MAGTAAKEKESFDEQSVEQLDDVVKQYSREEIRDSRLEILCHDIHKVTAKDGHHHYTMVSPLKEADMLSSRMARGKGLKRIDYKEVDNRIRMDHATCRTVVEKLPSAETVLPVFDSDDPAVVHGMILRSKELSCYNESKSYPFTSLKHHLLLACALAENFRETGRTAIKGLKLCLSFDPPENIYKLVGRALTKKHGKWVTLYLYIDSEYSGKGNANLSYSWKNTWNNAYGFSTETVLLGMNVMALESWTEALVTLEEAKKTCRINRK